MKSKSLVARRSMRFESDCWFSDVDRLGDDERLDSSLSISSELDFVVAAFGSSHCTPKRM